MTAVYVYGPTLLPLLIASVFLTALGVYSLRRRSRPGALPFAIACLFWLLWLIGLAGEWTAAGLRDKSAWFTFQALWQLPAVTAVTCFTLDYVYPGRYLKRRNVILLAIPPVVAAAVFLTNPVHHLAWRELVPHVALLQPQPEASGWLFVLYAMILALIQVAALGWLFVRSPEHRWPAALMMCGLVIARILYLLDLVAPAGFPMLNSSLLTLLIPALTYSIALFGFHIFDPLPAARRTVIEQMSSGVVVFDTKWRVVSLNPAAEKILGMTIESARGKAWQELLPSDERLHALGEVGIAASSEQYAEPAIELPVVELGSPGSARCYVPTLSPLRDFRGLIVGRLLVLADVTEQKIAQEHIVEHQRALAIIQERDRLARELHDNVAQTLAAAYLQANTAKMLLARGDRAQVEACLDDVAEATREAQADIREFLLGARILYAGQEKFFPRLREFLVRFTRQYGLPVELEVPPELEEQGLPQPVEVQLLRIVQEALSNVRKHAYAPEDTADYAHEPAARIVFTIDGSCVRVVVADNGPGFDPSALTAPGHGLRSMEDRAQAFGGSLHVISSPGQGAQVVVLAPLPSNATSGASLSGTTPHARDAA